jgi:DNA-binding NarL/FixJ family response regulator
MDVLRPPALRVALADDHPTIRQRMRRLLATDPALELVGTASNGGSLFTLCQEWVPAIVLVDLQMPGPPPSALVLRLLEALPLLKIILVSASEQDPQYVQVMTRPPVCGYILKRECAASLLEAIHIVAGGGQWYSPSRQTAQTTR